MYKYFLIFLVLLFLNEKLLCQRYFISADSISVLLNLKFSNDKSLEKAELTIKNFSSKPIYVAADSLMKISFNIWETNNLISWSCVAFLSPNDESSINENFALVQINPNDSSFTEYTAKTLLFYKQLDQKKVFSKSTLLRFYYINLSNQAQYFTKKILVEVYKKYRKSIDVLIEKSSVE